MSLAQIALALLQLAINVAPEIVRAFAGRSLDEAMAAARAALPEPLDVATEDDARRERIRARAASGKPSSQPYLMRTAEIVQENEAARAMLERASEHLGELAKSIAEDEGGE